MIYLILLSSEVKKVLIKVLFLTIRNSYNSGDMAHEFLPISRKEIDYDDTRFFVVFFEQRKIICVHREFTGG